MPMKIDCCLSEQCGSYHALNERIRIALAELGLAAKVAFHRIYYDDAVALGVTGSPTIRINGSDIDDPIGTREIREGPTAMSPAGSRTSHQSTR